MSTSAAARFGERDALRGRTDVELEVLVDVVARLEIGRDRRVVVRLGDAAEDVIAHDAGAEGDIPGVKRRPAAGPSEP